MDSVTPVAAALVGLKLTTLHNYNSIVHIPIT